ncbi:MAG: NAD(+)/NADH kinase [Nanoarchaeota archaeon]|nr:NAD(+)/NADH kinase [Nanoarchaeota archaeon]
MKLLVVYMKSRYEIYRGFLKNDAENPALQKFLDKTPDGKHLLRLNDAHTKNLKKVLEYLKKAGIEYGAVYRAELSEELVNSYDCIMAIGGDGTFLEAAGYIRHGIPIIGINTAVYFDIESGKRRGSEGYYCAMDAFDLDEKFPLFLEGKLPVVQLNRLAVEHNGDKIKHLVMNEVSIGPGNTHKALQYKIKTNGFEEYQFSSGLLIATSQESWAMAYPGSTVLALDKKVFQAVTRANYNSRYDLDIGLHKADGIVIHDDNYIEVESKDRTATIAIDGEHKQFPFIFGDTIKVCISDYPLTVIGFGDEKRLKYYNKYRTSIVKQIE